MTDNLTALDISTSADLIRVAEEVAASGESRLLVRGDRVVAILQPISAAEPKRRQRRPKVDPADDPLMGLIGMFDSGEPTDIARFKDRYVADAEDHRSW